MSAVASIPDRTLQQRMDHLELANKVRLGRADAKKRVKHGELTVGAAMRLGCCRNMPVFQLLTAQKSWGAKRALGVLSPLGVGARKPVGELSERQRGLVVEACERGKT